MEIPVVLNFYIKPSPNSTVLRSIVLKDYFGKLTANVQVLYPCQVHHGLLLCKSKRSKTIVPLSLSSCLMKIHSSSGREDFKYATCSCRWFDTSSFSIMSTIISTN